LTPEIAVRRLAAYAVHSTAIVCDAAASPSPDNSHSQEADMKVKTGVRAGGDSEFVGGG